MEGCQVRGPFALCEGAVLKMGTKVYGATTIGPHSVIGGEVKNSIFFGNSNKAHEGYIGDSVIGEWCNLGAGTSNSNVKNTAGEVKTWNYSHNDYITAGTKCGVIMGDHSKTAINTSINTGTVIGVCCNVFGEGLTPNVLQNFSWGLKDTKLYDIDKALSDITSWKKMKNKTLSEPEAKMLKHIFENRTV
jgi:NDP-sugar pyrophosphorylase family protein